jgi:hypothetical protein
MNIIAIAPASPSNGSSAPGSTSGAASQDGAFSLLFNEAVAATGKQLRSGGSKDGGHATATTAAPDTPTPISDQQDLEALEAFLADLSPEQLFSLAASPDVGPNLRALLLSSLAARTGQQPAFFSTRCPLPPLKRQVRSPLGWGTQPWATPSSTPAC